MMLECGYTITDRTGFLRDNFIFQNTECFKEESFPSSLHLIVEFSKSGPCLEYTGQQELHGKWVVVRQWS